MFMVIKYRQSQKMKVLHLDKSGWSWPWVVLLKLGEVLHIDVVACSEPAQFRECTGINGTWYNFTCWTTAEYGEETYNHYEKLSNQTGRKSASYEYFQ